MCSLLIISRIVKRRSHHADSAASAAMVKSLNMIFHCDVNMPSSAECGAAYDRHVKYFTVPCSGSCSTLEFTSFLASDVFFLENASSDGCNVCQNDNVTCCGPWVVKLMIVLPFDKKIVVKTS